jgi:negative regulator of sigma E activity
MKGDVLVDDGTNVWRYHRAENSAVKTKTAQQARAADRNTWHLRFEAKTLSSTKIGTRKAWIVAVSLKGNSRVLRKFWIDDASKIRLRSEQFNERGERIETHALSNLKISAVPETVFEFTPPRGAHISSAGTLYTRLSQAQHHAAWLRAPASLPRGYAFESAILDEAKNESWLRYTNGVRRFSIFQQRTSENKNSPLTRVGAGWYWQKDGNRFLVAGLPQTQASQIASSIR